MRTNFNKLAYDSIDDFIYGTCPNPVTTKSGLVIGGGTMYPEINFTLPTMAVNESTVKDAYKIYSDIINGVLKRAKELHAEGLVIEYESLPDFTAHPEWGLEIVKIIIDAMKEYEGKYGLKTSLRATPNDMREMNRPPIMRSGDYWEKMLQFFNGCGELGADFISIESTGGKELNDQALVEADIRRVIFSLGVLGCTDMQFLWGHLTDIAKSHGICAGGDSSCGFANTAMVLAERGFIPKTFAAVVRVATVPRALIAYEMGAVGISKDCEYAGEHLKMIAGCPIAMEGRMAAGAHLSPIGNIAACAADLWSNESIQQVHLLSEMAPVVGVEQLIYDCRMMNAAKKMGYGTIMRDIMVESDAHLDVQAYVLRPDVVYDTCKEIIKESDPLMRTKAAVRYTIKRLQDAIENGEVACDPRDSIWLDMMEEQVEEIPDDAGEFYQDIKAELDMKKFLPKEYGLG
jgi:methanol--5-hydroxybenzimidazolylcobamide Co-methyltransferase